MKGLLLPLALLLIGGTIAVAGGPGEEWEMWEEDLNLYDAEIEVFVAENGERELGTLTLRELSVLADRLSVTAQEESYVRRAKLSSRFMPGAGHFAIGEPGIGAAYTTGSILVTAGTVVGAYILLPEGVQFGEVDYIDDSFRDIGNAWRSESFASLLPAMGVLLGGSIVNAILAEIASQDAEARARRQIESGERRFEPKPFIFPDSEGRLMLGASLGY